MTVYNIYMLLIFVNLCQQNSEAVRRITLKLASRNTEKVHFILHQMHNFNFKFHFMGHFSLDNELFYSIFSVTFSYVIVMVQFELDSSTFYNVKDTLDKIN